jgi:hypothetical protein
MSLTMGVIVEIQDPGPLPALVEWLATAGCVTRMIGDGACHVVHADATDAAEEWQEVQFFLRAWQAQNRGAVVTLHPDVIPAPVDPRAEPLPHR